jgi:hypothetical protein
MLLHLCAVLMVALRRWLPAGIEVKAQQQLFVRYYHYSTITTGVIGMKNLRISGSCQAPPIFQ